MRERRVKEKTRLEGLPLSGVHLRERLAEVDLEKLIRVAER